MNALFWAVAWCCAAGWAPARADDAPCGSYTVAFYEYGALYYRDAEGRYTGIDHDVVEELSRRSGCVFKSELHSRARTWDRMSRSMLDLSVSAQPTPDRAQYTEFLPYMQARNYALVRRELAGTLPTAEAFLGDGQRRVVVVKSFRYGPFYDAWLERLRAQQRVIEASDFDIAVRLLQKGRADAMLTLPTSWTELQRKEALPDQFAIMDWAPRERILGAVAMSRQRVADADKQRLRVALESMLRDGSVDSILKRHVGEAMAHDMRFAPPPQPQR